MTKFTFKICVLGDGGTGKTTLLQRYIDNTFNIETKMTIGVEVFRKHLILGEDLDCDLQIWDFGGQERFRFFQDSFVLGAHGAIVALDLTARLMSINHLPEWINLAKKYEKDIPLILIGTKADLDEKIMIQDEYAQSIKEEHNFLEYIKTSSKSGLNVEKVFERLVIQMIRRTGKDFLITLKDKYHLFSKYLLD